jgi:hypothetical protein
MRLDSVYSRQSVLRETIVKRVPSVAIAGSSPPRTVGGGSVAWPDAVAQRP